MGFNFFQRGGQSVGAPRSPSKEFSSATHCRWYSDCTACNTTVNDSAVQRAFPGGLQRELLSRESGLHAKLVFCFPPFESIWVKKYKKKKKKKYWGNDKNSGFFLMPNFHKDCGVSTKTYPSQLFRQTLVVFVLPTRLGTFVSASPWVSRAH